MSFSLDLSFWQAAFFILDYAIKIFAVGFVPEGRRPSSSTAWLLAILLLPFIGLPLFLLMGSPQINRRRHRIQQEADDAIDDAHKDALAGLDEREQIKNPILLRQSVVMIVLVVVGFMAHGSLGIESCVVALTAAGVLMLISGERIEEALAHVEWTTLVFFAGLFIIVGALSEVGVIGMLAQALIDVTGGSTFVAMLVLLFASAIVSSFLDNIPFVATMIPILLSMEATGMDVAPLWWAVSLGACLGGNGTLIGASANVVMSDISRKNGHVITFAHFFKVGFPTMLATVAVSAIYLIVRFPPM